MVVVAAVAGLVASWPPGEAGHDDELTSDVILTWSPAMEEETSD